MNVTNAFLRWREILLLALFLLFIFPIHMQTTPEEASMRMVFFGDSYTYDYSCYQTEINEEGYFLSFRTDNNGIKLIQEDKTPYELAHGWPEVCGEKLQITEYTDCGIGGSGFSIEKNSFLIQLSNLIQQSPSTLYNATHIIIGGGFNEKINSEIFNGVTEKELYEAMKEFDCLLRRYVQKDAHIYLFSMGHSATSDKKNENLQKVYSVYSMAAKELGWSYFNISNDWCEKENYCIDNIHPNTKGVEKIGNMVAYYIKSQE